MGDLNDAAVKLALIDLPVLPLMPRAKRPRYRGSFHGATCDPGQVADHWATHPDDNIGLRPPLGVVVVDIDPRNGGDTAMRSLVAEHGKLPQTWTARTGSAGWHYWFVVGVMAQIRAHPFEGVDIKHHNSGFVVAPPSLTAGRYEWLRPPVGEPAAAPEWLREALVPKPFDPPPPEDIPAGAQFSVQCLVARIDGASNGQRNRTVYGACRDAIRQGDLDAFEPVLVAAALARGLPPVEVAAIVRSVRRRGR